MEPEGFATTLCSPILEERFAVCGGEEIAVDRWYHHLLVFLLVFLLSLMRIHSSNRALRDFVLFQVHSVLCHHPLSFGPQDSLEMFSNLTDMK